MNQSLYIAVWWWWWCWWWWGWWWWWWYWMDGAKEKIKSSTWSLCCSGPLDLIGWKGELNDNEKDCKKYPIHCDEKVFPVEYFNNHHWPHSPGFDWHQVLEMSIRFLQIFINVIIVPELFQLKLKDNKCMSWVQSINVASFCCFYSVLWRTNQQMLWIAIQPT